MNLLQPAFLAALGVMGVPLLIHFLHSRKLAPLDLGTLRFVRETAGAVTRWHRLRDWLLLLLRLLIVALAALLFARPFSNGSSAAERGGAGEEWIVVLDASASLRVRKPGAPGPETAPPNAAAELFAERLAEAPEDVRIVPLLLAESVREITTAAEAAHATGGSCDFGELIRWLSTRAASTPGVKRRVILFTDLQQPAAPPPDEVVWPEGTTLEIVSVLPPSTGNLSLVPPARRVHSFIAGKDTTLLVGVARSGAVSPRKFQARAGEGRDAGAAAPVDYAAEAEEIELTLRPARAGDLDAVVRIRSSDPWPLDDQCELTPRFTDRPAVLLLDGNPGGGTRPESGKSGNFTASENSPFTAGTYYLRQALLTPDRGQTAGDYEVTVSGRAIEDIPDQAWRVIALCNVAGVSEAGLRALAAKVRTGTGLLLFPGDKTDTATWSRLAAAGLCPARLERNGEAPVPRPIAEWKAEHPALTEFAMRQEGDLSRIVLRDAFRVTPAIGAAVLASMEGPRPALVAGTLGKGRILLFANPADRSWSDFPRDPLFLPLMRALCGYAAAVPANAEDGLPEARDVTLRDNQLPGRRGGVILRVPAEESTAPFLDETPFRSMLRLPAAPSVIAGALENQAWRGVPGAARPGEWWPWLAGALLVLVLTETFLADHRRASARTLPN